MLRKLRLRFKDNALLTTTALHLYSYKIRNIGKLCQSGTFVRMTDLSLHAKTEETLRICQWKMERRILNVKSIDRIPNSELRERSRMKDVRNQAQDPGRLKQWKWGRPCGQTATGSLGPRYNHGWIIHATTVWDNRNGKRRRGRPKCRCADDLQTEVGADWTRTAKDRMQCNHARKDIGKVQCSAVGLHQIQSGT